MTRPLTFPQMGATPPKIVEKNAEEMYSGTEEEGEAIPALNPKSELQHIVSATLKGQTLSKPTVILFHTSDKGSNPKKPTKAYKSSQAAFALFQGNGLDVNASMALHFAFDVRTCDVGTKKDDKEQIFRELNVNKVPKFVVVDTNGKVLASVGAGGKVSPAQLMGALKKGAKAMDIDLGKLVGKQQKLLRDIVRIDGQIQAMKTSISCLPDGPSKRSMQKKLDKLNEDLQKLKEKETELWSEVTEKVAT